MKFRHTLPLVNLIYGLPSRFLIARVEYILVQLKSLFTFLAVVGC